MIELTHRVLQCVSTVIDGQDTCQLAVWWDYRGRYLAGPMDWPEWFIKRIAPKYRQGALRAVDLWAGPIEDLTATILGLHWCKDDVMFVQDCGPSGLQLASRVMPGIVRLSGLDATSLLYEALWSARHGPMSLRRLRSRPASKRFDYQPEYTALVTAYLARRQEERERYTFGGMNHAKC